MCSRGLVGAFSVIVKSDWIVKPMEQYTALMLVLVWAGGGVSGDWAGSSGHTPTISTLHSAADAAHHRGLYLSIFCHTAVEQV